MATTVDPVVIAHFVPVPEVSYPIALVAAPSGLYALKPPSDPVQI